VGTEKSNGRKNAEPSGISHSLIQTFLLRFFHSSQLTALSSQLTALSSQLSAHSSQLTAISEEPIDHIIKEEWRARCVD